MLWKMISYKVFDLLYVTAGASGIDHHEFNFLIRSDNVKRTNG